MQLSDTQYEAIKPYLPIQRGNVAIDNHRFLESGAPIKIEVKLKTSEPFDFQYGKEDRW